MDQMNASTASIRLTEHPLQRCGAWAVTALAGCERVEQVTPDLLDGVVRRIVEDVVEAAAAQKGVGAYDWWKVLFALYPNSKPTHAKRTQDRAVLREETARMFAPDPVGGAAWACTFCGQPGGVLWAKSTLPMFDSIRALNTLPPKRAGWPVCHGCRVALWALPYGAWLTAGSATVLTCDNPQIERRFADRNAQRAGRIRHSGFDSLPATAGPEAITLQALREYATDVPAATTLWMFKNDNQEPWLRVSGTRMGVALFAQRLLADPDCAKGWRDLRRALEIEGKRSKQAVDGETAVARLLFDREGHQSDRLLRELVNRSDVEKVSRYTLIRWRALCRLYVEVMYEMDPDRIKPVAEMLASWIGQESHRSRFNQYRRVAGSGYELHKLLVLAAARLSLDRKTPQLDSRTLTSLTSGPQSWERRMVLFFEVLNALEDRKIPIGAVTTESEDEDDKIETKFDSGKGDEEREYS